MKVEFDGGAQAAALSSSRFSKLVDLGSLPVITNNRRAQGTDKR